MSQTTPTSTVPKKKIPVPEGTPQPGVEVSHAGASKNTTTTGNPQSTVHVLYAHFIQLTVCRDRLRAHQARPGTGTPGYPRVSTSSTIVTGPSFTSSTCIRAPNLPVLTGTPSSRSASQKRS